MTTQKDYKAKIRGKSTVSGTGLTEDVAKTLYAHKGRRIMAIVELEVEETHENKDGDRKVDLVIVGCEPIDYGSELENHARELQRATYQRRKLNGPDQPLEIDSKDDLEPDVADVIARGKHLTTVPDPDDLETGPEWGDGPEPAATK